MDLPVPWLSTRIGTERSVTVRIVSAGEFYERIPEVLPLAEREKPGDPAEDRTVDLGWELWADQVLERALEIPRVPIEEFWRLGPDRTHLIRRYFQAVGFVLAPDSPGPVLLPARFQDLLRRLSQLTHRLPHELLALPVDCFHFNAQILCPELFAPPERDASVPYTNDPALLESMNG